MPKDSKGLRGEWKETMVGEEDEHYCVFGWGREKLGRIKTESSEGKGKGSRSGLC